MQKEKKILQTFTLTPSVIEEFRAHAVSIGSNASYEIERLIRAELKKIKQDEKN